MSEPTPFWTPPPGPFDPQNPPAGWSVGHAPHGPFLYPTPGTQQPSPDLDTPSKGERAALVLFCLSFLLLPSLLRSSADGPVPAWVLALVPVALLATWLILHYRSPSSAPLPECVQTPERVCPGIVRRAWISVLVGPLATLVLFLYFLWTFGSFVAFFDGGLFPFLFIARYVLVPYLLALLTAPVVFWVARQGRHTSFCCWLRLVAQPVSVALFFMRGRSR